MPDNESMTVRLPKPLYDRLQRTAKERVVGVSLLVELAVEQYLATLPPIPTANTATPRATT